jgi:hypothetical protein
LEHPQDFHPEDFSRRVSEREVMTSVTAELLTGALNPAFRKQWDMARSDSFASDVSDSVETAMSFSNARIQNATREAVHSQGTTFRCIVGDSFAQRHA